MLRIVSREICHPKTFNMHGCFSVSAYDSGGRGEEVVIFVKDITFYFSECPQLKIIYKPAQP